MDGDDRGGWIVGCVVGVCGVAFLLGMLAMWLVPLAGHWLAGHWR
jgi:hypothetical protein